MEYTKILGKVTPTTDGVHDHNLEYDRLCIVTDGPGRSFISKTAVPKYISIDNTTYWQPLVSVSANGDDITIADNGTIQLSDIPAESGAYGRKNVRKRKTGETVQEWIADVFNSTYTRYIIKYAHDLEGETLNIPADSVLDFQGGKLHNGSVVFSNTGLRPYGLDITEVLPTVSGTLKEGTIYYDGSGDKLKIVINGIPQNIAYGDIASQTPVAYTWIVYGTSSNGANLTLQPTVDSTYIGISTNRSTQQPSTNPIDYVWVRIRGDKGDKGEQGLTGEKGEPGSKGEQGQQGIPGNDGIAISPDYKLFAFKASETQPDAPTTNDPNYPPGQGGWFSSPSGTGKWWMSVGTVIGSANIVTNWSIPVQCTAEDGQTNAHVDFKYAVNSSTTVAPDIDKTARNPIGWSDIVPIYNETQYLWITSALIDSNDILVNQWASPVRLTGEQGQKGEKGDATHMHVKYSNNPDGADMTDVPSTYIGIASSTSIVAPSDYKEYKWSRLKGSQGIQGDKGIQGETGPDGRSSYLHIKYSNDGGKTFTPQQGSMAIGEQPGDYMGTYVDFIEDDSTDVNRYTWHKVKGEAGPQGIQGPPGADGIRYYTWVRYADGPNGEGISNDPLGKSYLGLALNKTSETESNDPNEYTWSLMRGTQGTVDSYKSIVFKRSDVQPTTPTGGSYLQPVPADWFDAIPNGTQQLWMSTRIFSTDGTPPQQGSWSAPAKISASSSVQIKYSSVASNPGTPDTTPGNWVDNSGDNTVHMAVRSLSDGVWSQWNVTKVKGETGAQGQPGQQGPQGQQGIPGESVLKSIVFCRATSQPNTPVGGSFTSPIPNAGWYDGIPAGTTAVWQSSRIFTYSGNAPQQSSWSTPVMITETADFQVRYSSNAGEPGNPDSNPGAWSTNANSSTVWMAQRTAKNGVWSAWQVSKIKGETGQQLYTWIRYSDNADGSNNYDVPNDNTKYIGIGVNKTTPTESANQHEYVWSKFRGNDGQNLDKQRIPYSAGTFKINTTYERTLTTVPYVLHNGAYYLLNQDMFLSGDLNNNPETLWDQSGHNEATAVWVKFNNFKAIFTEILVAQGGELGGLLFDGQYLYSKHGVNSLRMPTTSHERFGLVYEGPNYRDSGFWAFGPRFSYETPSSNPSAILTSLYVNNTSYQTFGAIITNRYGEFVNMHKIRISSLTEVSGVNFTLEIRYVNVHGGLSTESVALTSDTKGLVVTVPASHSNSTLPQQAGLFIKVNAYNGSTVPFKFEIEVVPDDFFPNYQLEVNTGNLTVNTITERYTRVDKLLNTTTSSTHLSISDIRNYDGVEVFTTPSGVNPVTYNVSLPSITDRDSDLFGKRFKIVNPLRNLANHVVRVSIRGTNTYKILWGGRQVTSIDVSAYRQLELVLQYTEAFGKKTPGWVVVNQSEFVKADTSTTTTDMIKSEPVGDIPKGITYNTIAIGLVNNGSLVRAKVYGNNSLTVARRSQGMYRVTWPLTFNSQFPMSQALFRVTPMVHSNNPNVYSCIAGVGSNYFDVWTSDDTTPNDGQFVFEIIILT